MAGIVQVPVGRGLLLTQLVGVHVHRLWNNYNNNNNNNNNNIEIMLNMNTIIIN